MEKDPLETMVLMMSKHVAAFVVSACLASSVSQAQTSNGARIFSTRCALCHGDDMKGTGPLAGKSTPPTPDLTTRAFKDRLHDYPGVIVSSIILRPNGDLIPRTLRDNKIRLPAFAWTVKDFRDLNEYMNDVIARSK